MDCESTLVHARKSASTNLGYLQWPGSVCPCDAVAQEVQTSLEAGCVIRRTETKRQTGPVGAASEQNGASVSESLAALWRKTTAARQGSGKMQVLRR